MTERPEDQPGWAMPPGASDPPPPVWPSWNDPHPSTGWDTPTADPTRPWAPPPPPTAPTLPAPPAASGPPRRRRGKGWLVTLLVVLALIVALAGAGTGLFVTRTLPPYDGAKDFLNDVAQHDQRDAADRLCAADAGHPTETLQGIDDSIDRSDATTLSANPLGVSRSGSTATVTFTVTYHGGRADKTFRLAMALEGGSWKACPSVS